MKVEHLFQNKCLRLEINNFHFKHRFTCAQWMIVSNPDSGEVFICLKDALAQLHHLISKWYLEKESKKDYIITERLDVS